MELLQIIFNFITQEMGDGAIGKILSILKENSFDLKKTVSNLKLETVTPILKDFLHSYGKGNSSAPNKSYGVEPISNIADKDIVYTLNKYLGEN